MELHVLKTGNESFDLLHSYGLAIIVATLCETSVTLDDKGPLYAVVTPGNIPPPMTPVDQLIDTLFALPDTGKIDAYIAKKQKEPSLPLTILDGMLALPQVPCRALG